MYALFIYNVSQILITNINIYLINFYYLKVIDPLIGYKKDYFWVTKHLLKEDPFLNL